MSWYPIAFLPPQYENASGLPYSGAVLKAYAAGTSNVIPMATSYTGATTASSIALNASGYPVYNGDVIIPHVQENYKLMLYPTQAAADLNTGALWTVDDIQIADSTNTPFVEYFDGNNSDTTFTLSEDLGNDEEILMVFADRPLPDYVSNGTFATDTIWTKGAGWTIGAGVATATGAISTDLTQNAALNVIAGHSYTIEFTITRSAGGVIPKIGGTSGTERTSSGTYKETIIAGSTQAITFSGNAFTGTVDTVTVKPTYAALRQLIRPDEYTLLGTQLTLSFVTPTGTKNIIVFAPSLLLGAANNAAAAAATSETNAANSAAAAAASAASAAGFSSAKNKWTFSTTTTMADPSTGGLRFDNATHASVTAIAISDLSANSGNPDVSPWVLSWDNISAAIRGTLYIFKDEGNFAFYSITGASTDNSGWTQLAVTHIVSAGTISNGNAIYIGFAAAGEITVTGGITALTGDVAASGSGSVPATVAMSVLRDHGQCRLIKSGANLVLTPFNGNKLIINSLVESIPSAGVSLAPTSLTPGTTYYIYAYMSGSTMTLEASATTHAVDTTTGVEIKSADATRTLVGMARCITGPAWADSAAARLVASWFNRKPTTTAGFYTTTRTTGSTSYVELNSEIRAEFMTWGEQSLLTANGSFANNTLNAACFNALGIDGVATRTDSTSDQQPVANLIRMGAVMNNSLTIAEGYHYVTHAARVDSGTGTWYGSGDGVFRIQATIEI